jgi:hypothetical protein
MSWPRIFLLSPAHCGGKRAAVLTRAEAAFDLAERFRSPEGATLGEVFAFLSGLYFRGKLAYSERFAHPPFPIEGSLVITSSRGLLPPHVHVGPGDLDEFATVPIDLREPRYREPLIADLERLRAATPPECRFVLLGSVASPKYVELLAGILGARLLFPDAFAGMGDMQRGALLLRAAREGVELPYLPVLGATLSRAASRVRGARASGDHR